MMGGYPCQPFSVQRSYSGATDRTSKNQSDHPLYKVLMEGFPAYLKARKPAAFILENVIQLNELDSNYPAGAVFAEL